MKNEEVLLKRRLWLVMIPILIGLACPAFAEDQGGNNKTPYNTPPATPPRVTQRPHLDLTIGLGMLKGDTCYQIGGLLTRPNGTNLQQPDPTSELVFPLDVTMLSLKANLGLGERFLIGIGFKKNLSQAAGKMEDSDWGVWYLNPPYDQYGNLVPTQHPLRDDSLDIYSESDAELDALIWDINVGYRFVNKPTWSFTGTLGLIRQQFNYDVSDPTQWYPSSAYYFGDDLGQYTVSGKVLTYDITYTIPYLMAEVGGNITRRIRATATIGYSPFVWAADRDHHLYGGSDLDQGSIRTTDSTGHALTYGLHGWVDLSRQWTLGAEYEHMDIRTSGDSKTTINGYSGTYSINEDVKSRQQYLDLTVTYGF
jgi:hypothetical protein